MLKVFLGNFLSTLKSFYSVLVTMCSVLSGMVGPGARPWTGGGGWTGCPTWSAGTATWPSGA